MVARTSPRYRHRRLGAAGLAGVLLLALPLSLWPFAPADGPVARPGGQQGEGGVAVSIVDFAFSPPTINIAVGETVTWTNNGTFLHTSTRTLMWDSGDLSPGGQFSFTFNAAGSFSYFCSRHASMMGTVNVGTTSTPTSTATRTPTGTATRTPTATSTVTGTPPQVLDRLLFLPAILKSAPEGQRLRRPLP
jgi:plastocyanin